MIFCNFPITFESIISCPIFVGKTGREEKKGKNWNPKPIKKKRVRQLSFCLLGTWVKVGFEALLLNFTHSSEHELSSWWWKHSSHPDVSKISRNPMLIKSPFDSRLNKGENCILQALDRNVTKNLINGWKICESLFRFYSHFCLTNFFTKNVKLLNSQIFWDFHLVKLAG